jgi:hypothetical protein
MARPTPIPRSNRRSSRNIPCAEIAEDTLDDLAPDSADFGRFAREQRRVKEQVLDQTKRVLTAVQALPDTGTFETVPGVR